MKQRKLLINNNIESLVQHKKNSDIVDSIKVKSIILKNNFSKDFAKA